MSSSELPVITEELYSRSLNRGLRILKVAAHGGESQPSVIVVMSSPTSERSRAHSRFDLGRKKSFSQQIESVHTADLISVGRKVFLNRLLASLYKTPHRFAGKSHFYSHIHFNELPFVIIQLSILLLKKTVKQSFITALQQLVLTKQQRSASLFKEGSKYGIEGNLFQSS